MASVDHLSVVIDAEAAKASIASLSAALELSDGLADRLVDAGFGALIFGDDLGGLFRCEAIDRAALGAGELHGFRIMPDQRYIELVAAVTSDGDPHVSGFMHGWPILSVGSVAAPTVTDGEGAGNALPGGAAQ